MENKAKVMKKWSIFLVIWPEISLSAHSLYALPNPVENFKLQTISSNYIDQHPLRR